MTNLEKANAIWKEIFGVDNGFSTHDCPCPSTYKCSNCPLNNITCKCKEWWNQEYDGKIELEPITDWSKVPTDTLIIVKASDYGEEYKRYFAKYENKKVYAWSQGRTSATASGIDDIRDWKYARLAESEDING